MNKILFPRLMATLVTLLCLSTVQLWAATYSQPASYARSDSYRTGKPDGELLPSLHLGLSLF